MAENFGKKSAKMVHLRPLTRLIRVVVPPMSIDQGCLSIIVYAARVFVTGIEVHFCKFSACHKVRPQLSRTEPALVLSATPSIN